MSLPSKTKADFSPLLDRIRHDFPGISFEEDKHFRWSSEARTVYYDPYSKYARWLLLHELGHVVREHDRYKSDRALVRMEVEAWDTALILAGRHGIDIDEDYIQDCMDSYRNWQFMRSKCPRCSLTGVEQADWHYRCINCGEEWRVTANRFCRVYRRRKATEAGAVTAGK